MILEGLPSGGPNMNLSLFPPCYKKNIKQTNKKQTNKETKHAIHAP
jgi:hypothetical protein